MDHFTNNGKHNFIMRYALLVCWSPLWDKVRTRSLTPKDWVTMHFMCLQICHKGCMTIGRTSRCPVRLQKTICYFSRGIYHMRSSHNT